MPPEPTSELGIVKDCISEYMTTQDPLVIDDNNREIRELCAQPLQHEYQVLDLPVQCPGC